MENRRMGILDREPGYAKRLAEYISAKEGCHVHTFTFENEQEVSDYLEQDCLDILLVGQSMASSQVRNWDKIGQLILLNEGEEMTESPSVYKFQAADGLFREVMDCYARETGVEPENRLKSGISPITGVYSPVKRCGKTILSFVLAAVYAEQQRCLLISLDEFCMIAELKQKGSEKDLADIMFLYRKNPGEAFRHMGVFGRIHGLEYIPPVTYPWDLRQIRTEELARLILWAASEGGYDRIVLDIGEGGDSPLELLDVCSRIYMPVLSDPVSAEKLRSFEAYMEQSGNQYLLSKIKKIELPSMNLVTETGGIESLLWSPVENFARGLIEAEE